MTDIVYYKNKMDAWGPNDHGDIKNLELYKSYKAKYESLLRKPEVKNKAPSKPKLNEKLKFDFDGDGDEDADDRSLAAKLLGSKKGKKKSVKKSLK